MLPKSARLSKNQVEEVLKTGRRFSSTYFLATATRSSDSRRAFAVVVSKKVAPTAVLRNKLRRRVYNAVRTISKTSAASPLVSVVVTVKREAVPATFADFCEDLKRLLTSARIVQ